MLALLSRLRRLSKINAFFLAALVLRIVYALAEYILQRDLPLGASIRLVFILAAIIFLIGSFPKWVRRSLWRVRYRLLATWVLVGVVPIVLICALVGEGLFILMGQMVGYMTTSEITRRAESIQTMAQGLAWSVSQGQPGSVAVRSEGFVRGAAGAQHAEVGAVVRIGDRIVASEAGSIRKIPSWSKPGFRGLVKQDERNLLAAHVAAGEEPDAPQVFLYQRLPDDFFGALISDVGVVRVLPAQATVTAGGIDFRRTDRPRSGVSINTSRRSDDPDFQPAPAPPGRGSWDIPLSWFVLLPSTELTTGMEEQLIASVASRPSLVVKKLFSSLGPLAAFPFGLMVITASALLVVEVVAVLFGAALTRSITRSIADLHEGTQKVRAGDFSHRIRARRTKDQLAELAGSFNMMTEQIQNLIVEVKEKERLENELQIAREVQSQLFPKELPRLRTLEFWGGCQPARTVSGDYYDVVSLGSDRAALAIGDISGKGISAALLMAHIQSALRSQLMLQNGNGMIQIAPAAILAILNDHLYTSSAPEKYATFFLGVYADDTAQLTYTNAGHLAPMLVRRGKARRLDGEGFPIGLFPGIQFEQQIITLEPGDLLAAFTDGVTETPDRNGEEFGDRRLSQLLERCSGEPLDQVAGKISDSVSAWSNGLERHDDTTLLLARRV